MKSQISLVKHLFQEIVQMSEQLPSTLIDPSLGGIKDDTQIVERMRDLIKDIPSPVDLEPYFEKLQFLQEINQSMLQMRAEYFTAFFQSIDKSTSSVYTDIGQKSISSKTAVIRMLV